MDELITEIAAILKSHQYRLVTAESCTGGGVAYFLTNLAGSSEWFDCGFVTYSNEAKIKMLGVNETTIHSQGAVSEETAREMAEGALKKSRAELSLAVTGIAGPAGGSQEKPVGTVWFAFAGRDFETRARKEIFTGGRQAVREKSILFVLQELLNILKTFPE